ncbi:hypothetical protein LINGRAHAP2_LOCUS19558 [Linum grandiflorum]
MLHRQEAQLPVSRSKQESILCEEMAHQIYLAQVSITNAWEKNQVQTEVPREDNQMVCPGYIYNHIFLDCLKLVMVTTVCSFLFW